MPTSHLLDREPVVAAADDTAILNDILRALEHQNGTAPLLVAGRDGEAVALPDALVHVLRRATTLLARERAVMVIGIEKELTTQEAASILSVSRPYLVQLLESGEVPFIMVGSHRRVRYDDLMAYKRERDTRTRAGLRSLTEMSQEFGLYPPHTET